MFIFLSVIVLGQIIISQTNDTIKRKILWDVVDTTGYNDHQKQIILFLKDLPVRTLEEIDREAMEKLHLSFTSNTQLNLVFEEGRFKSMTSGFDDTIQSVDTGRI
jgi:hypothetical protein